ncbi:MAG: hypothetical protein HY072_08605, partial [Deltaproteobacteria bacterium]|nr:hypothetical protein [Deltaproteobacteria bacterium]
NESTWLDLFETSKGQIVLPTYLVNNGKDRIFIRSLNFSGPNALLSQVIYKEQI